MTGGNSILAKMAVLITANNAQFNQAMQNSSRQIGLLERSIGGAKNLMMGAFGGYTLYRGLEYGIRTLAQFEKQMDTVAAITGATGQDLQNLEKDALRLGKSTEYTATAVAKLQTEYARLGFSTQEIIASTEATLNLATATGEDLSRSAEIAGSTLRAFGLNAVEMQRVTDVMSSSFNKSALALDSFADSIKYVAPVAAAVDVSLEETTAMLGVLADAGIKGSQAGTSLRRIFTLLTNDGRPLVERLDELAKKGISLADANDEVGLYAQTALLVLARENDAVKELTKSLGLANGETERMADIMRDNLIGDWNKFTSAVEGAVLEGKGLVGVLREIVQIMTMMVGGTEESGGGGGPTLEAIPFFNQIFGPPSKDSEWDDRFAKWEERYRKTWDLFNAIQNIRPPVAKVTVPELTADQAFSIEHRNNISSDKTPMTSTVFQMQEYEEALIKGLAAQNQFADSNLKLTKTFEQSTAAAGKNIDTVANESAWEGIRANMVTTAQAAEKMEMAITRSMMSVGDAIGDALVSSIESGESFVQSLLGQTDQIVNQLYRQAVAWMVAKAMQSGGPIPFANIAIATAGMIAIRGLFAGIRGGGSSGASTVPKSQGDWRRENDELRFKFQLSGSNLVAATDNLNRNRRRTGI